jgi:hypothetical protein
VKEPVEVALALLRSTVGSPALAWSLAITVTITPPPAVLSDWWSPLGRFFWLYGAALLIRKVLIWLWGASSDWRRCWGRELERKRKREAALRAAFDLPPLAAGRLTNWLDSGQRHALHNRRDPAMQVLIENGIASLTEHASDYRAVYSVDADLWERLLAAKHRVSAAAQATAELRRQAEEARRDGYV